MLEGLLHLAHRRVLFEQHVLQHQATIPALQLPHRVLRPRRGQLRAMLLRVQHLSRDNHKLHVLPWYQVQSTQLHLPVGHVRGLRQHNLPELQLHLLQLHGHLDQLYNLRREQNYRELHLPGL